MVIDPDPTTTARSYLYVPGTDRGRLDTSAGRGADAVIADLEDAVAVSDKDSARATVGAWLSEGWPRGGGLVWVRVNATSVEEDLAAVVAPPLTGVVVPKAEPELLTEVDRLLAECERREGLTVGGRKVIALVETARGLLEARQIAAAPRVVHLGIGEADLMAELRVRPSESRAELTSLRLRVVVAAAAAGIGAPIAPTSTDFGGLEAFRRSATALRDLGFRARTAIHPAQVAVVNEVFTPSDDEVREARDLVDRFESAGSGVVTDRRGRMVDLAVVRTARETLARARPAGADGGG